MVDRYRASSRPTAGPVAQTETGGLRTLLGVASDVAGVVQQKLDARSVSLETASLNSARLELERQGTQLALDLQKDRVAGSDYVKDLQAQRQKLKSDVWAKVPKRVQSSQRAMQAWDNIWTADEIGAGRSATAWQADQEQKFAKKSAEEVMNAASARIELNPDSVQSELKVWKEDPVRGLPAYAGLLDAEQLAAADDAMNYAATLATVRGLANQDRYKEAEKVIEKAGPRFNDQKRESLKSAIEGVKNDKHNATARAEAETNRAQRLAGNALQVDILYGRANERTIQKAVDEGRISVNDQPALIGTYRTYQNSLLTQSKLSDAQKAEWADWSMDAVQQVNTMPPEQFMRPVDEWPAQAKQLYDNMDPDRQRGVRQRQLDMIEKGGTQDAGMAVYRDLVSRAKRLVPEDWKLGSDNVMGEGDGLAFSGQLYRLAQAYAVKNGGEPITTEDARTIVARALNGFKPYKPNAFGGGDGFGLPPDLLVKDAFKNVDTDLLSAVRGRLQKNLGREPTNDEITAAYKQVSGQ